ncbi:MAG: ATP-dependent nuclease [Cetobacterium sp.]|uniref:ATP-dependent nuclease n=1 Tax=unclassified Cetobacterium TaxID=2630983 RepID=UPI000648C558|nr:MULTISPECIES: AAA family ATPase [unclassified Cetobacterium]
MDMKKIMIANWQSIEYVNIEIEKLLILIGESNRGKTSILKALSAFFGQYEIKKEDFKDRTRPIEIRIKCYKTNRGFLTLKLLKRENEEIEYYIVDHGIETKVDLEIIRAEYISLRGAVISSKDNGVYEGLLRIRDIFMDTMDSQIIKDLNSKLEYLGENKLSQSLQRKILFSFLKNILYSIDEYETKIKSKLSDLFLIFEEPELHLNPQESREMYSLLIKLSKIGVQIILETHSSYFVGLKQYKSICLIKKIRGEIKVFQYTGKLLNGDEIKNFNMNYWINPDRGEMFFAKKVILVEGQTDKIALSYLAKKIGVYNYSYSIIECGSKSIIPQFIKVLNGYKIPYVAVYDKDNHRWRNETELDSSNLKNKKIRGIVNRFIGDYIEFENDIEEEICQEERERKNYKNKPYYTLQKISELDFIMSKKLENKIRRIYK